MATLAATYRRFFDRPEALMIAALTAAAITLIAAAVIGGRHAQGSTEALASGNQTETGEAPEYEDLVGDEAGPKETAKTGGGGTVAVPGAPGVEVIESTGERVSEQGATREGVHTDYFEFGVHAPVTLGGVPLNLAEDPITGAKGYITYINRNGGVNGLKVRLFLEDDKYETSGGQQASDKLVKEIKPFFISGTLGIDQIAIVAKAAGAANPPIPYMAGGGPEPEFKDVGMYQILSNYDQYLDMVIEFICKYGPAYVGGKTAADVRLGTTTLNSVNILPVEKRFVEKISARNCVKEPIPDRARGKIQKPTEQTDYTAQGLDLQSAYGPGVGANLVIPLQDPISTSRQVAQWKPYDPKWTIADFAHESDTALSLMGGSWTGERVMAVGCYYHPDGGGDPYNESKCMKIGAGHKEWVSLGHVDYDQNAGGSAGGKSSYDYNEDSWKTDGSGGIAGYHFVHDWLGAMKATGTDPTREKFIAALNAYENYSDVITGPLTFKGSPNRMIGPDEFVLFEGKSNLKWRQVTEITPGLVDHF